MASENTQPEMGAGDEKYSKNVGDDLPLLVIKRTPIRRRFIREIVAGIDLRDVAEWRASMADELMSEPTGKELI